jgi:hypothetical protein
MAKEIFVFATLTQPDEEFRGEDFHRQAVQNEVQSNLESVWPYATVTVLSQMCNRRPNSVMAALTLLDDIASSPDYMTGNAIEDLCAARALLASVLGLSFDDEHNRFTPCS